MDKLISLEPSSTVAIRVEVGQKCTGTLVLRNVMYTMPVAFRLQAFNKSRYTIRPQSGIISPLAILSVEVTYHLPTSSYLPESFPHCDDSFVLHSVVVPGAGGKDSQLDSVPVDLFTSRKKQMFSDSGIRVMFVGGLILAQLIKEGSMDEIREVLEISDPSWKAADSVDHNGHTLLHLAITQGRPDLVQLLLEFQPDIEARGKPGSSALEVAAASGEALIVELLLAHGANTERFISSLMAPIHIAAGGGHMEVLRLLLLKGANVDSLAKDGNTALHLSVQEGRRDCARLLLASGARADIKNFRDGDTPLHVSSSLGDEQMVKFLLKKGANKYIRNNAGKTAFDVAAEHGHSRLFDALKFGDALCLAARKGEMRKIQRLLENGASINGKDQHGWTALHRASFKGKLDAVCALIEKGVDLDAKDEDGYTALHCAVESGFTDVVQLLIKRGSDVEARTNKGMTPVQIAESLKYSGITRVLVHGGASKDTLAPSWETQKVASFPYANRESDLGGMKQKKKKYPSINRSRALRSSIDRSMPPAVL